MAKSIIGTTGLAPFGPSGNTFHLGIGQSQTLSSASEIVARTEIDRAATLRNFRAYVSSNTCVLSTPFNLRKNGVNIATVSVLPSQTGWFQSIQDVQIAPGDFVNIQIRAIGGGNIVFRSAFCELEETGDGAHTYLGLYSILGSAVDVLETSGASFFPICGLSENNSASNDTDLANQWARVRIPVAGTLKNLRVNVRSNTRSLSTVIRTRIDGSDGVGSVVIPPFTSGDFEDPDDSDPISAGATAGYKADATGPGPFGQVVIDKITTLFESIVNQTPIIAARSLGQSIAPVALQNVFLRPMGSRSDSIGDSEVQTQIKIPFSTTVFRFSAHVSQVTGSSLVLRTRVNGSNGNQAITVPVGNSGTFEATGEDILNANDLFNAMVEGPALASTYGISWLSTALGDPLNPPPTPPPPPTPGVPCDNPTFLPEPCDPTPIPLDLLWPFHPNWAGPVEIAREFKTDIIVSRSGREQRRATRQEGRRFISFQNVLVGADRREYDMLMALNQHGRFTVPDWSRHLTLTEELSPSETSATYAESEEPEWFFGGEPVVLAYGAQVGLRFAAGINTDGVLDFEDTDEFTWPAGTKVYPGLLAFHQDLVSTARLTNDVTTGRFVFFVDPGANVVEAVGEPDMMFEDREIFLFRPNWAEGISATDVWPVDLFDVGIGRVFRYLAVRQRENTVQMTFVRRGREEADGIDRFFMRHFGRAREFYAPTHANDIVLATGGFGSGDSVLLVEGEDFAIVYGEDSTRGAISVVLRDGTRINRSISSITVDSNGVSAIALTQTMGQTVSVGEILMISWLNVCRFGSDELTMQWLTDGVANCRLSVVILEHLPAEIEHTDSNTGL